mmetsp:Transcript_3514/g.10367  ORF Transcript_3514/g.10367 Transcript_3514/m.10367 type:complete len:202 (-) Transcript_3514:228-833(-)
MLRRLPLLAARRYFGKKPGKRKLEWTPEMEAAVLQQMGVVERDAAFQKEMGVGGAAALSTTESADKRTVVSEVDAGGFELNGDVYVPSAIACLAHSAFLWKARTPADITVDAVRLFTVVHPRPEIVVVGLGARGPRERLAEVEAYLKSEGIALEQSDTPNAVHTFNILNDERRHVGGAFLTLEPRGADEYADPFEEMLAGR